MMDDKDIEEYHNIGRKIRRVRNTPTLTLQGPRNTEHGSMM